MSLDVKFIEIPMHVNPFTDGYRLHKKLKTILITFICSTKWLALEIYGRKKSKRKEEPKVKRGSRMIHIQFV